MRSAIVFPATNLQTLKNARLSVSTMADYLQTRPLDHYDFAQHTPKSDRGRTEDQGRFGARTLISLLL
jgi:hypothetical protein